MKLLDAIAKAMEMPEIPLWIRHAQRKDVGLYLDECGHITIPPRSDLLGWYLVPGDQGKWPYPNSFMIWPQDGYHDALTDHFYPEGEGLEYRICSMLEDKATGDHTLIDPDDVDTEPSYWDIEVVPIEEDHNGVRDPVWERTCSTEAEVATAIKEMLERFPQACEAD